MTAHRVVKLSELPLEANRAFKVAGRSVLLCRTVAGLFALENKCSHQFQPLEGGRMRGHFLFCPKHSQRFDMRDGSTAGQLTRTPLIRYDVRVDEEDFVEVELPE